MSRQTSETKLLGLPPEVLILMLTHCDLPSLWQTRSVCSVFYGLICTDEKNSLWKAKAEALLHDEQKKLFPDNGLMQLFIDRHNLKMRLSRHLTKTKSKNLDNGSVSNFFNNFFHGNKFYVLTKEVNLESLSKALLEDDAFELFSIASNYPEMLPYLAEENPNDNEITAMTRLIYTKALNHGSMAFIEILLPFIMQLRATRSFSLFFRFYFSVGKLLDLGNLANSNLYRLIDILLISKNNYWINQYITMAIKHCTVNLVARMLCEISDSKNMTISEFSVILNSIDTSYALSMFDHFFNTDKDFDKMIRVLNIPEVQDRIKEKDLTMKINEKADELKEILHNWSTCLSQITLKDLDIMQTNINNKIEEIKSLKDELESMSEQVHKYRSLAPG